MAKKRINKTARPHEVPEDYPLTKLEDVFVDQFLIDMNGARAWMRARGGDVVKPSDRVQASRVLQQPNVLKVLEERRQLKRERAEVEQDEVLRKLVSCTFAKMTDLASWNGLVVSLKNSEELTGDQAIAIKKVSNGKYGPSIEKFSPEKGFELIMKHLGMLKEKHEHSGPDGKPIGFEAAYQQAAQSILDEVNGAACGLPQPVGNRPTTETEQQPNAKKSKD
jgi:phage terminase small subunit